MPLLCGLGRLLGVRGARAYVPLVWHGCRVEEHVLQMQRANDWWQVRRLRCWAGRMREHLQLNLRFFNCDYGNVLDMPQGA